MQGILTPEEIQDLLRAPAAAGPVAQLWDGEAVPFDLLQAGSLAQAVLPRVQAMQTKGDESIGKSWSAHCRRPLACTSGTYELLPMSDALAQIAADTVLAVHWRDATTPLDGLLLIERAMFYTLFASLLGGDGGGARTTPLTKLERNFLDTVLEPLLQAHADAWRAYGVAPLAIETVLQTQEAIAELGWTNEAYRGVLTMAEKDTPLGTVTWLVPAESCALLNDAGGGSGERSTATWAQAAARALEEVPMSVQVEMGIYPTRIRRVLTLQPGDVIAPMLHEQYPVLVRGHVMFVAAMGAIDGQRAVQIAAVQPQG